NSAIGWIDNQRRSPVVQNFSSGVGPIGRMNGVRGNGLVWGLIKSLRGTRFELALFLVGQILPPGHVRRPFQWRDRAIVPCALKIRIAPRRARRSPLLVGGPRSRLPPPIRRRNGLGGRLGGE